METSRYEADVALVREGLSGEEFEDAFAHGAALSIQDAVALAREDSGRARRPAGGWASLTQREHQVAALVADGLPNAEIAERLFIAFETVKTHLSNISSKLGVAGRMELAREVLRHRQDPR